eukprot:TRINITY_DN29770_c0_g1_i1.p1 TRINITY_DN29770_c0_g1~~TRINITY_DN29770_c0_g1_i1.p1  ORF type:complete len:280 (+),score=63.59 TRINITY_DN29770_c0_g1_i1:53-892(+)
MAALILTSLLVLFGSLAAEARKVKVFEGARSGFPLSDVSKGHGAALFNQGGSSLATVSAKGPKVKVELFEESLCPYCSAFIQNELQDLYASPLFEIVDLKIIPYGNAKIAPDDSIVCQHGPPECVGNLIESCAIALYPDVTEWFPFIRCLASAGLALEDKAEACAEKAAIPFKPLEECYTSSLGDKLVRENGAYTDSLEPAHSYVPWLVVDGKPAFDDYDQVAALVCEAYQGNDTPPGCNGLVGSKRSTEKRKEKIHENAVCHNMGNAVEGEEGAMATS